MQKTRRIEIVVPLVAMALMLLATGAYAGIAVRPVADSNILFNEFGSTFGDTAFLGNVLDVADINGRAGISFAYDSTVVYAELDDTNSWQFDVVEAGGGNAPSLTEVAGQPALAYSNFGTAVKYARYNGTTWDTSIVDNVGTPGFAQVAVINGQPAVAYLDFDPTFPDLKYAVFENNQWTPEPVASTVSTSTLPNLVEWNNNPAILFQNSSTGEYTIAYKENGAWEDLVVTPAGTVAFGGALAIQNGQPVVAYNSGSGSQIATYDGQQWSTLDLISAGNADLFQIAIDGDTIYLAYTNFINNRTTFSTIVGNSADIIGFESQAANYVDIAVIDGFAGLAYYIGDGFDVPKELRFAVDLPPEDVNRDFIISPADAVEVINNIGATGEDASILYDLNASGGIDAADAQQVIDRIGEVLP